MLCLIKHALFNFNYFLVIFCNFPSRLCVKFYLYQCSKNYFITLVGISMARAKRFVNRVEFCINFEINLLVIFFKLFFCCIHEIV